MEPDFPSSQGMQKKSDWPENGVRPQNMSYCPGRAPDQELQMKLNRRLKKIEQPDMPLSAGNDSTEKKEMKETPRPEILSPEGAELQKILNRRRKKNGESDMIPFSTTNDSTEKIEVKGIPKQDILRGRSTTFSHSPSDSSKRPVRRNSFRSSKPSSDRTQASSVAVQPSFQQRAKQIGSKGLCHEKPCFEQTVTTMSPLPVSANENERRDITPQFKGAATQDLHFQEELLEKVEIIDLSSTLTSQENESPMTCDECIVLVEDQSSQRKINLKAKNDQATTEERIETDEKLNRTTLEVELERALAQIQQKESEIEHLAEENFQFKEALEEVKNDATQLRLEVQTKATKLIEANQNLAMYQQRVQEYEDALRTAESSQAQQNERDFAQEQHDRESAIEVKSNQFDEFKQQQLAVQLAQALDMAENEKKERLAVVKKLKESVAKTQALTMQLNQEDFAKYALQAKSNEMKKERESAQMIGQMEHFRSEASKLKQQLERADVVYQQNQNELLEQIELLSIQLELKTNISHGQRVRFEEQLKQVTDQLKAKEEKLEILAAEKQASEERLMRELSQAKSNTERLAKELIKSRGTLETALANTVCLHDDVLAKTAQVKQYKKQTDRFKLQAEDSNNRILKTQEELQQSQERNKRLKEDHQIGLQRCQERNEMLLNANQRLKTNIERLQEECQRLSSASQQRKENELAPFNISQLPNLGEHQGSGSYGSVYRIQLNGVNCIAKKLHDILLGQGREEAVGTEDKSAIYEKFQRECVLLSRMRHPNIVQFMGVHFGPERDYGRELTLVMERLYMNLEECLKKYQNIDTWLKVTILLDISQGLLHLHSQGIVHRDLTAPNILLTTSFHAKIADLGVSKILSVHPLHATKQSMIPGALGYMPPEVQAEVPQYGYPLDIFSFGVLMLFVIIQEYPQFYENAMTFTGFQHRQIQIQKRMKWISRLSPEDPMRQLICRCLQDDPQRRPTTIELNSKVTEFSTQHLKPYKDILDMQKRMQAQHPHDNWRFSQYPVQFPMASTLPRILNSSRGRNHQ